MDHASMGLLSPCLPRLWCVVMCDVVLTIRLLTAFILGCVSAHFRLLRSASLKEACNICHKCFSTSVSSFGWPCEWRCHWKPPSASKRFKQSFIFQPNSLHWWPNIFAMQTYPSSPKYCIAWHPSHAHSISWGRASSCDTNTLSLHDGVFEALNICRVLQGYGIKCMNF